MRRFLQRLVQVLAYTAASLMILMAIALGLFRLFLPRLPEYQEQIKAWASQAIGAEVEFGGMDARWGLSGPELNFYDAELSRTDTGARIVAAGEVGVGLSLVRLVSDRRLVVDSVMVSDTLVELRQTGDGRWEVLGTPIDELLQSDTAPEQDLGAFVVVGENIDLLLVRPGGAEPTLFTISRIDVQRDERRVAIDANVRLPAALGRSLSASATLMMADPTGGTWNVAIETDELRLAGLSDLLPYEPYRFNGGVGRLDVAMAWSDWQVANVTGSVDFENVSLADGLPFDVAGRFEVNNDVHGWLVAADNLHLGIGDREWPQSSLRVETSVDEAGEIVMLDARATYLNLGDFELAMGWLDESRRLQLDQLRPDGVVRELTATFSDINTESPRYSIVADLEDVGFAASGERPGLRGFSGSVRADHTSGLVEIESEYMILNLSPWLSEPVEIDAADGTVIWRRSGARTTVLSDSISVRSSVFSSETDVEITIEADKSPYIDLASTWSIEDIAAAKRYIPQNVMKPKLYMWFQDALVAGRMTSGTTRLYGPLDKFPFDNDEGRFLIRGHMTDGTFRYLKTFPAAQISELDVVLDNMRLYTRNNRSISNGNTVVDANVEIADLRRPVLTIDAYSTGTLASLKNFAEDSVLSRVFGGQLGRISASGDATFSMDLRVPIQDWRSFEIDARIMSNNGTLEIAGLDAPITDLTGTVQIGKDSIASEALGGTFLGEPVSIELMDAPAGLEGYRAIARTTGTVSDAGIVNGLGLPIQELLSGNMSYVADVMFPRANDDEVRPLQVRVSSSLEGMAVQLPAPFTKPAGAARTFAGELSFSEQGSRIEASGEVAGEYAWRLEFARIDDAWDFDRGALTVGGLPMFEPEVRGLHIRGRAGEVRLQDWLDLARSGERQIGVAERIRSIDVDVDNLYLLGQHFVGQGVRVDRSARDWLVQFDGEQVSGSVFVPYEFSADRELVLDMDRLVLPGDDGVTDTTEAAAPIDPRALPSIRVNTEDFAIGERHFGAVTATFRRTPDGLSSDDIVASDDSFDIAGSGTWVVDDTDPSGYRTNLTATLTSRDVEATMQRLDYSPGISSGDLGALLDVNWSGGPRMDFLGTLDGTVQVRLGSGQLEEVEPGAGRMFGLLSIVALPRRLSLDFRDVFQKGFAFDEIVGNFRLDDGNAWTCDLYLEGPAANIGIIGRVDLLEREYDQSAVVSASVGSTLPVLGGIVGGPQTAVVVLLFSQIFKDPLEQVGQVFYDVSGSFDEPTVVSADADAFADRGRFAGCLADSE